MAKQQCTWEYDEKKQTSTCIFPDGHKVSYDLNEIDDPAVNGFLKYYGHKQFIQDKTANIGKGATSQDKAEVHKDRHDMLADGKIYKARVGGGTVRKPTFQEFYEAGKKQGMNEEMAKTMYGQLYPVKSK
jgi:hypothetical protein